MLSLYSKKPFKGAAVGKTAAFFLSFSQGGPQKKTAGKSRRSSRLYG
jgi:hypothetical protein